MSLIPETIEMQVPASVLADEALSRAVDIKDLQNPSEHLTEPPYREVMMSEKFMLPMDEKVLVLPADEIGSFIQRTEKLEFFPKYWSYFSLVHNFWEKTFDITVENEKYGSSSQLVRVIRNIHGKRYAMEWIEEDVTNDTTESTKIAITASALLPDALWPKAARHGFVAGNIEGTTADGHWKMDSDSLLVVPDMRKDFGNSKDSKGKAHRYFKPFRWSTIEKFIDQPRPNEGTDFVFIYPVGVFADTRDHKIKPSHVAGNSGTYSSAIGTRVIVI